MEELRALSPEEQRHLPAGVENAWAESFLFARPDLVCHALHSRTVDSRFVEIRFEWRGQRLTWRGTNGFVPFWPAVLEELFEDMIPELPLDLQQEGPFWTATADVEPREEHPYPVRLCLHPQALTLELELLDAI